MFNGKSELGVFTVERKSIDYIYPRDETNTHLRVFHKDLKNNAVIFLLVFESLNTAIFWISLISNDKHL